MFITQISLLGTDYRCWTGMGSFKGCNQEAAALRKHCRGEKFVAMGPGDWQSEHVLIEVFDKRTQHKNPGITWDGEDFKKRLKALRQKVEGEGG